MNVAIAGAPVSNHLPYVLLNGTEARAETLSRISVVTVCRAGVCPRAHGACAGTMATQAGDCESGHRARCKYARVVKF